LKLQSVVQLNCAFGQLTIKFEKSQMKNPWIKKNPFLSMWLSGANAAAGSARSRATIEGRRQAATMMKNSAKQMTRFWSSVLTPPPSPKRKKKRR
jgi:hypothetical protein